MFDLFSAQPAVKVEAERDFIAGQARSSNLYPVVLKYAYLDESKPNAATGNLGGAYNINLVFDDNGVEFKQQEYISSGKAKGQKNTYTNDKGTFGLPGYVKMEAFFKQFTGVGIAGQQGEEKVLRIWNGTTEVDETRKVFTALTNTPMILGIVKLLEDKHNAPGETVEKNEIDKFFNAEGLTAPEVMEGLTEGVFKDKWLKANLDKVKDKRKNKGASKGVPAKGVPNTGAPTAGSALFGK